MMNQTSSNSCLTFCKKGFDVSNATDGEGGLKQAISHQLDIIVSDILMPKSSGVKMCTKMKETDTLKNIPVIFLSGTPDDMVALAALDAGGDHLLSKP